MKTLSIEPPKTCIGRWAVILIGDSMHVGTAIDHVAGRQDVPKRIRIQRGARQGDVVMLGEYEFKTWLDETQVDP